MNEIDLAWTAGIIDGEGSIFIMSQKRLDRERDTNYILRVSVESTDPYMTTELKRMFPEGAEFIVNRTKNPNHSDSMKWQLNGRKASSFLSLILPYMRVKNKQAKLAIEFHKYKKHWKNMTALDYQKQFEIYQEMKQLKTELKLGYNYVKPEEQFAVPHV